MYLQALDNGFVVLEPGVEFISVDNLPKVVSVSCCTNMFSCKICHMWFCDRQFDTRIIKCASCSAQNNDTIKPIETKTIDLPIVRGRAHWGKN
jgi:hypothetical protein